MYRPWLPQGQSNVNIISQFYFSENNQALQNLLSLYYM